MSGVLYLVLHFRLWDKPTWNRQNNCRFFNVNHWLFPTCDHSTWDNSVHPYHLLNVATIWNESGIEIKTEAETKYPVVLQLHETSENIKPQKNSRQSYIDSLYPIASFQTHLAVHIAIRLCENRLSAMKCLPTTQGKLIFRQFHSQHVACRQLLGAEHEIIWNDTQ